MKPQLRLQRMIRVQRATAAQQGTQVQRQPAVQWQNTNSVYREASEDREDTVEVVLSSSPRTRAAQVQILLFPLHCAGYLCSVCVKGGASHLWYGPLCGCKQNQPGV